MSESGENKGKGELSLRLGQRGELDLNGLSDEEIRELKIESARAAIRLDQKATELAVEAQAVQTSLKTMTDVAATAAQDGTSVTITRTIDDSLGRTEVIMGNTETAQRGKLTRSQAGLPDNTLMYVIIGAVVLIILAIVLSR